MKLLKPAGTCLGATIVMLSGIACSAAADSTDTELLSRFPESTWLANNDDILQQLQEQPAECLDPAAYTEQTLLVDLGRAAFRSPTLLGGQAARMGLSCDSCHRNGHDNPAFFIDGISGQPGTLDVSHGFFSEVRDDGIFNPVVIPDLLDLDTRDTFGSQLTNPDLEVFLHSVIVDEFSGRTPTAMVMDSLIAYLHSLDSQSCPASETLARDLSFDLALLENFISTLMVLIEDNSPEPVITLMTQSVQTQLQQIYLRFSTPRHQNIAEQTMQLSRALRTIVETSHLETLRVQNLQEWINQLAELQTRMTASESSSLYRLTQ